MVAANHCQLWGFKISIYQNVNLVTFFYRPRDKAIFGSWIMKEKKNDEESNLDVLCTLYWNICKDVFNPL